MSSNLTKNESFASAAAENFLGGEEYHHHVVGQVKDLPKNDALVVTALVVLILREADPSVCNKFIELLERE